MKIKNTQQYVKDKTIGKRYVSFYKSKYELFIEKLEFDEVKSWFKRTFKKKPRHLDFACGTGRVLRLLETKTKESIGLDISQPMLNEAKKQCKSKLVRADILKDKLKIGKFDLITSFRFILNMDPSFRKKFLVKLREYLKKDGFLVINIHRNKFSLMSLLFLIWRPSSKGVNRMCECDAKKLFKQSGLKLVDTFYVGFLPGRKSMLALPRPLLWKFEKFINKTPLKHFSSNMVFVLKKN